MLVGLVIKQKADAASFSMSPATKTFSRGCQKSIDIFANASGQSSNAAEIIITYDPTQIDIIDNDGSISGTQIQFGTAYENFFYNQVNESTGVIRLAALSFSDYLSANELYGTINFISTSAASTANFTIQFDGAGETTDSNIADSASSNDLLTAVVNGSYTFITAASCADDFQAPTVTFTTPVNNQTSVSPTQNAIFRIVDADSGINLSSLQFIINGVIYDISSPQVSYTGSSNDYTFTIDHSSNFPAGQASILVVQGSDSAGNNFSQQIIFFTDANPVFPPGGSTAPATPTDTDNESPTVIFRNPENLEAGVPANSNIIIELIDNDSGVELNSVVVYLNGIEYRVGSPGFSFTGTANNYIITITPTTPVSTSEINSLRISGEDSSGNSFDRQIVFNIPISDPVSCPPPQVVEVPSDNGVITINNSKVIEILKTQNCLGEEVSATEVTQIIGNFLENEEIFKDTILENTIVQQITQETGVAGFGALLTGLLISLSVVLPFITFITVPGAAIRFIGIIFGKKSRDPWGVVTDALTGKPIPFAICQLYTAGSTYKVNQSVSDLEGRYGFVISPGDYRLEVTQTGYKRFVKEITIKPEDDVQLYDIKLSKNSDTYIRISIQEKFKSALKDLYKRISSTLFYLGILFSTIAFILTPNLLNIVIFLIYIAILSYNAYKSYKGISKYAAIVDSETSLRIPYAQVKIFDTESNKLIDSIVTNYNGLFDYYGDEGKFAIYVEAKGYKFPSKNNSEPIRSTNIAEMILVDLKKGRNDIQIFMDPINQGLTNGNSGNNMINPFS